MRKYFVFSGASLCFGRTETLRCAAGKSRWSNKAQLIMAEGVRLKDKEAVINSFIAQSSLNPIAKPVAHISLDFSA